jgi:hypothetical protein
MLITGISLSPAAAQAALVCCTAAAGAYNEVICAVVGHWFSYLSAEPGCGSVSDSSSWSLFKQHQAAVSHGSVTVLQQLALV